MKQTASVRNLTIHTSDSNPDGSGFFSPINLRSNVSRNTNNRFSRPMEVAHEFLQKNVY
jgi:hypothetical protein